MRDLNLIVTLSILAFFLLIVIGSAFQEEECVSNTELYQALAGEFDVESNLEDTSRGKSDYVFFSIADISAPNYSNVSTFNKNDNSDAIKTLIIKYTAREVDLMSEADSLSYVIGIIPKGTSVQLYENCDCEWICVAYQKHFGYVRSADLVDKEGRIIRNATISPNPTNSNRYVGNDGHSQDRKFHNFGDKEADISAPAGATALCNDGTYSFSRSRQGTCSWHGGVKIWLK